MSNPVYVRVAGDEQWHWLGSADDIQIKHEVEDRWGRPLLSAVSYYIELKK